MPNLVRDIDDLRAPMKTVKNAHPFAILAMVVLSEHLHAIWRLSSGDADYPLRWSLIKAGSRGGWLKASIFVPEIGVSVTFFSNQSPLAIRGNSSKADIQKFTNSTV